ncbi:hypothetical protein [Porphyromonas sp.]|uniref:hypothetical protein n=1 Tax=Porphyromonas sp. TaxID=1924944 RepID=UPI0026DBC7F5|nr:hypothetical protein [Porphyromonas sp.]MDO4770395.1 hypothetical protein [Porphyromonas sp.]
MNNSVNRKNIRLLGIFCPAIKAVTALWLVFAASLMVGYAQIVTSRQPLGVDAGSGLRGVAELPTFRTPYFDVDSARIEMESEDLRMSRAYVFAHKLHTNIDIIREGRRVDRGGRTAWYYRVRSKGAKNLNFFFDEFRLPEGGLLFIYTPDMSHVLGGFGAVNNNSYDALPTGIIQGDEVIIECQIPTGAALPKLRLSEVNHGVRTTHVPGEPRFDNSRLEASKCAPNVACMTEYAELSRSVLVLSVNGTLLSSAAMINNTRNDGTPYVISAYHVFTRGCVSIGSVDQLAKTVVVFFNYASPACSGEVRGTEEQTMAGATLVGVEPTSDAIMIKLNSRPPRDYNPYYCGWNLDPNPRGSFVNIHHPRVLPKRVTLCHKTISIGTTNGDSDHCPFAPQRHWEIPGWDVGTTQPGSSGSPLFDADNLFIGALTGGASECATPHLHDFFYAFHKLAEIGTPGSQSIISALRPDGESTMKCFGFNPYKEGERVLRISHIDGVNTPDLMKNLMSKVDREKLLSTANGVNAIGEKFSLKEGAEMLGFYTVIRLKGAQTPDKPMKYAVYADGGQAPIMEGEIRFDKLKIYAAKNFSDNKRSPAPYMEVYMELPRVLKSSDKRSYIIALDINSIDETITPLVQEKPESDNTLYFRQGNNWEAASTSSVSPLPTGGALWIDPLMTDKEAYGPSTDDDKELFTVRVYSTDNITVSINRESAGEASTPTTLDVFDLAGRKIFSRTFTVPAVTLPRANFEGLGVLVFRVRHNAEKASLKVYFPAT